VFPGREGVAGVLACRMREYLNLYNRIERQHTTAATATCTARFNVERQVRPAGQEIHTLMCRSESGSTHRAWTGWRRFSIPISQLSAVYPSWSISAKCTTRVKVLH